MMMDVVVNIFEKQFRSPPQSTPLIGLVGKIVEKPKTYYSSGTSGRHLSAAPSTQTSLLLTQASWKTNLKSTFAQSGC